ncbi:TPA: TIGR04141 family sporadically distributed protein [Pseudomonas aeruginosa]|nr:TIGR04141 family sporadically distributed protein [Pseudomonas aeruginosa]
MKSFTGKDNISLKIKNDNPLNWESLIPKLQTLEDAYNQDNYLQVFQGYSKFHFENDPNTIQQLDSEVFERIRNGNFENIHLSPPGVYRLREQVFHIQGRGRRPARRSIC